jgi:hypothetical protein
MNIAVMPLPSPQASPWRYEREDREAQPVFDGWPDETVSARQREA